MTRYWLAAHAYVAVLGPQTVFFDANRRSFSALRSSWFYALRATIEDWSLPETSDSEEATSGPIEDHAAYLAKRGILTTARAEGKSMEQLRLELAQHCVIDQGAMSRTTVGSLCAARILYAGMLTAWKFRHRTFDTLLHELASGRRAREEKRARASPPQVSQLVSMYWRLRPLLPFDTYTDLLDSLTLIRYLSSYLVFPKLVIGVRLMPFTTYTWVQDGSCVFNDHPEFVRQFTPIFSA